MLNLFQRTATTYSTLQVYVHDNNLFDFADITITKICATIYEQNSRITNRE